MTWPIAGTYAYSKAFHLELYKFREKTVAVYAAHLGWVKLSKAGYSPEDFEIDGLATRLMLFVYAHCTGAPKHIKREA
jgi:hypothetical protein